MITIGIADDHTLIINGIIQMLRSEPRYEILFSAQNGSALLAALTQHQPDVLLLDIELPDNDGISLCGQIKEQYPQVPIIALTNHDEIVYVRKMIRSGANGYLLKGTGKEQLIQAMEAVLAGEQFIDRQIEQTILQQTISGRKAAVNVKLTNRELEILSFIAHEYSNQEIADRLFLSVRTVESHRHSLNQKLNIKTTAGLVKEAYLRGLI
ncbi:response regulator transcription factor [Sphingobacterium phlebotomi]|uniref:Response regulator transcription factor n=1 Tax=Sphingobacterium phlebotomi TaxID=2605433 RepID=A0A5D4HDE6_9SPHI|nr:response regulator transcription factor [Sphingobacterium phlebotomi]TYR37565.1 response regulator transcription factor [Sphingobacterium phlebotomi]